MPTILRDYLLNILSSLTAASIGAAVGLGASKFRLRGRLLSWFDPRRFTLIALPERVLSIRNGLRGRFVFLALGLALAMSVSETLLNPGGFGQAPRLPESYAQEAESVLESARQRADGAFRSAEEESQKVLENANRRAFELRKRRTPGAEEEARSILSQASDHANQILKWNEEQNKRLFKDAEQRAAALQKTATQVSSGNSIQLTSHFAAFVESILWGLLMVFYVGQVSRKLGSPSPSSAGFVGACALIFICAIFAAISDSAGILTVFGPFFLASALVASSNRSLSSGEVIINSGYMVYQRFSVAVMTALVASLSAIVSAYVVSGLAYSLAWLVNAINESDDLFSTTFQSGPFEPRFVASIALFLSLGFFQFLAAALSGAAFLPVLIGAPEGGVSEVQPKRVARVLSPIGRLLLLYKPSRPRAWIAHLMFYLSLGCIGVGLFMFGDAPYNVDDLVYGIELLFWLSVALCFRSWAIAEVSWQSHAGNEAKSMIIDRPRSGRELIARLLSIISATNAIATLTVTLLSEYQGVSLDLPRNALSPAIMIYTSLFCRRWATTESIIARKTATESESMPPMMGLFHRPKGMGAWWSSLTSYAFLAWTVFFVLRVQAVFDFDDISIESVTALVVGLMFQVILPLYASNSWASAELKSAFHSDLESKSNASSKETVPPS